MIINSVGNYIETRDRLGYKHGYKDFLLEYKRRFKTPRPIPKHTVSEEVVKRAFNKNKRSRHFGNIEWLYMLFFIDTMARLSAMKDMI